MKILLGLNVFVQNDMTSIHIKGLFYQHALRSMDE